VLTHGHPDHCVDIYGLHVLMRYGIEREGLPVFAPEGLEGYLLSLVSDFGNVFDSSLDACLAGERYTYTQRMLLGEVPSREDIPCRHCHLYQNRALERLVRSSAALRVAGRLLSWRTARAERRAARAGEDGAAQRR